MDNGVTQPAICMFPGVHSYPWSLDRDLGRKSSTNDQDKSGLTKNDRVEDAKTVNNRKFVLSPVVHGYLLLRGQDLNLRPLGYEPSELPNCSTPRR
jgi:hypothetical protein